MKPILFLGLLALSAAAQTEPFPVTIDVDAAKSLGDLKPIWRMFGADEPNYATMKDGTKLIGELGELRPKDVFFRTHNLLCSGDGTPALKWGSTGVYSEDADGKPIYDWKILDGIFDTYLAKGVHPYAQIGFMPEAMSIHPQPYQHQWKPGTKYSDIETGWAYPPKDYAKWSELVFQWVKHCIGRYGREEVEKWYWEVWNEPNGAYWKAKPEEFFKLHDYAIDAVRRALPTARVGGPDVAGSGGKFMEDFMKHVTSGKNYATGKTGTPTDFLSFHAKGSPGFVDGYVRMGIADQLRAINSGFGMIRKIPELKDKAIVIGESDPDGCAACQGPQLGYRNTNMYSSYTAASFARKYDLAARHGVNLDAALTWAFEFEDQPFFAGQRVLASRGIDLPVMNVFRMFSKMSGKRVEANSTGAVSLDDMMKNGVRGKPDVAAFASRSEKQLWVLVWHYHDDDVPGPDAQVSLSLASLPIGKGEVTLTQYRIDNEHSNAFIEWQVMGSPAAPDADQYATLVKAGQLAEFGPAKILPVTQGHAKVEVKLPRQAVELLVFNWK
ncbi:MAG: beta-xylosidase [Luteolibacter sp.]|uniref:GH39 family glycosyl hydrolase n=1 Tax=Luteolibacter sp. TaxID=1962973 RepID=UPI003266A13D